MSASRLWSFVYSINFQKCKFQPQTNIFRGNRVIFCIEPTVLRVMISGKALIFLVWNLLTTSKQIERNLKLWKTWSLAHSAHSFVSHFQCFKVGEIIGSKYGHLMLRGVFPDKLTLILIYRRSSSSMWCSSCKNTFVGTSSLQMIANKYWCEYMCTVSGLSFMCSFSFLRNCSM